MPSNLTSMTQLRKELTKYLTGKKSLSSFHRWFVAAAWDVHLSAPKEVEKAAHEIQWLLDEYSYGNRAEEALKVKLRPFVTPPSDPRI